MKCYIDTSAAMKLVVIEDESVALRSHLDELDAVVFSSILLETELRRGATANGASQGAATTVLSSVELVGAPRALFAEAGLLAIPGLRSLDALHLATAIRDEADLLLAYDRRLLEAAELVGLTTTSPA